MELSLGGSFGGLSLLADLGDRIPADRRPCQHLNRHVQQNWFILLVMKALIIRRALVWYVRIFKIKLQNCIFQILCNISNSLHHFKFASWLWILCSLAGLVTDGQNEYYEKCWRWLKEIEKEEKSESWVFHLGPPGPEDPELPDPATLYGSWASATITTFSLCSQLPASSFVEMNCDQEKIFFLFQLLFVYLVWNRDPWSVSNIHCRAVVFHWNWFMWKKCYNNNIKQQKTTKNNNKR